MYIYDMVSDLSAFDKNILHTRGWCLQERLLSPRIVHFAHPQMYWECRLRFLSEDGDAMVGNGKWRLVRGDIAFASVMSSWRVFVADFSKSEFTNTSDKLPALAGLAHTVQRCIGDDCAYLAGIWEKDLPSALLWVRGSGKEVRRSVGWRAPSWSWAALDGEVTYENVGVKETSGIARDREGLARVVEWNMEPVSDANVYGAVRRGWLMVSARVSHVKRGMKGGLMWRNGGYFISDDGGGVVGEVMFDDNTIATPVHFECVLMGSMGGLMLLALAVISTGHEGHYFRVGCARLFGGDYFAGSTARELTLH